MVSLSPALTELIYALNLQDLLVGVSECSDYPDAAKAKPTVGPFTKPHMEKLLSLGATLVVLPEEGTEETRRKLNQIQIPFLAVPTSKVTDIGDAALKIAEALDNKKSGEKFKSRWEKEISELRSKNKKASKISNVGILVQTEPPIVAGQNTFLDEALEICGAKNIFSQFRGYSRISKEVLFNKKVQYLVVAEHVQSTPSLQNDFKKFRLNPIKIFYTDPSLTTRPGPRLIQGIKEVCLGLK